jgi:hypothetical protein
MDTTKMKYLQAIGISIIFMIAEVRKLIVRVICVDHKLELFRCFFQYVLSMYLATPLFTCPQILVHSSEVTIENGAVRVYVWGSKTVEDGR